MLTSIELQPKQEEALAALNDPSVRTVLYGGSRGPGKALDINTPIATPTGWTIIGCIRPGDMVFAADGTPSRVLAVSPVYYGHDCYEVEFSDGSIIVADGEHVWETQTIKERQRFVHRKDEFRSARRLRRPSRGKGKRPDLAARNRAWARPKGGLPLEGLRTTEQIAATLRTKHSEANHAVRAAAPLELPDAALPIDPYVLGVWLGDGNTNGGNLTQAYSDHHVIARVSARWGQEAKPRVVKSTTTGHWGMPGLRAALRSLGVLGYKHIPPAYLRASKEQRLELLRGLMDTDGTVDKRDGGCSFTTTLPSLRDGMSELLASLGIKSRARESRATLKGEDCGPVWDFLFLTHLQVFTLARKMNVQKQSGFNRCHERRYIVDVRRIESRPVKCITIDHESHLYLAGESMIPTHNSFFACAWLYMSSLMFMRHHDLKPSDNPFPFAFLGRKVNKECVRKTMQSWRDAIPRSQYIDKAGAQQIIIHGCIRIDYGGLVSSGTDVSPHKGGEYCYVAIDEAQECEQDELADLLASQRRQVNGKPVRYKTLFTANPAPGWLKRDFIDSPLPGNKFIRALCTDNKHLPADYIDNLRRAYGHRPELLRAYLEGDWNVLAGLRLMVREEDVRSAFRHTEERRGQKLVICDPSRMGGDECVTYVLDGRAVIERDIRAYTTADQVADVLLGMSHAHGDCPIALDDIGPGGDLVDLLPRLGSAQTIGLSSSKRAGNHERFLNVRAEMWDWASKEFHGGHVDLTECGHDGMLMEELCSPQYDYGPGGRIKCEDKLEIKKRIGRSPGRADALVMGLFIQAVLRGEAALEPPESLRHLSPVAADTSSGTRGPVDVLSAVSGLVGNPRPRDVRLQTV